MDPVQSWNPPQELMLPTPRPVRKVSWLAAARHTGTKPDLVGALVLIFALLALPVYFWSDKLPDALEIFSRLVAFVGGFASIGVLLFTLPVSYFAVRKAKWLLKWGKPTRAVVTDVGYARGSKGFGTWISTLEYQDDAGNLVKRDVKRKLSKNQVVTVLYDPDKPSKCIDYPVAGYEVGGPERS